MSGHTPGPWEVGETISGRIKVFAPAKGEGDDWSRGWVAAPASQQGRAAMVANARLIAAAPELLAGLKDVFALMQEGFLVRDISKDGDPLWALNSLRFVTRLKEAADAVAKATGEKL